MFHIIQNHENTYMPPSEQQAKGSELCFMHALIATSTNVPFMCLVRCIAKLAPKSLRSVLRSGKAQCITIPKSLVTLVDSRYIIPQTLDGFSTHVLTNLQSARVPTESPNSSHDNNTSGIYAFPALDAPGFSAGLMHPDC